EPLILGHEVAGDVVEVGPAVARVRVGDRVAVDPSRPCWRCRACREGRPNLCARMSFYGSAAVFPHVQGAFRDELVCDESQCHVVPPATPHAIAAMAEPLAVCLHAIGRAGPLLGRRVLITGCGPIGALTCIAARAAGAAHVAATDVVDPPLRVALDVGADETINAARAPERIAAYEADQGWFDVAIEASGSPQVPATGRVGPPPRVALDVGADETINGARAPERIAAYGADKGWFDVAIEASGSPQALITCLACTRPGGRIVQLGMLPSGAVALP